MTALKAANYAKVLFQLEIPEADVKEAVNILENSRELTEALNNPIVKRQEKEAVIDAVFSESIRNFIKVLILKNRIDVLAEIFREYEILLSAARQLTTVDLTYVVKPDDEELERMKDAICKKYNKTGISLKLKEDPSLIGGYVMMVEGTKYDKSVAGMLRGLKNTLAGGERFGQYKSK